jgi:arylsulfatase A-like enzyme
MTNIALVVLDSLRKDTFDAYFDWLPGARYESAWSSSGWTVPAHGTLFTGRYPSESGVYAKSESLTTEIDVLAEVLSDLGYTTRGFSANANISDAFEFTRGFDEFHHSWRGRRRDEAIFDFESYISRTRGLGFRRFPLAIKEILSSDVRTLASLKIGLRLKARDMGIESIAGADDGAQQALDLVENRTFTENEFLFMNLMEAHTPYEPPNRYKTVDHVANPSFEDTVFDGPQDRTADIKQAYEDSVRYLADIYEELFSVLERDFEYIITVSDHGEMFGRDGIWAHNHGLYPELTRVPLSVYSGRDGIRRSAETVGFIDLFPTVVSMAGGEIDSPGRDLRSVSESGQYLTERHGLRTSRLESLQENDYRADVIEEHDRSLYGVIRTDGSYGWDGRDQFLTTPPGDPGDYQDLIEDMRSKLDIADVVPDAEPDLPADVQSRLQELGYV